MAHSTALAPVQRGSRHAASPPFTIARGSEAVALSGDLTLESAETLWRALQAEAKAASGPRLTIDLGRVRFVDGVAASMIGAFRADLAALGIESELRGANASVAEILALFSAEPERAPPPLSFVERLGAKTLELGASLSAIVSFVGELAAALVGSWRRPRTANWGATVPLAERAGADAVPIVVLINFLVGLVMAHHSAAKLQQYGAAIYVADIVVLSVTRELGALMTAIILAGRTGAAFTAEIATMKVSEEIDALRTLGFGPVRYLALPRILALALVAPLLVVIADLVGCAGGLLMAAVHLDITPSAFVNESLRVLKPFDVISGLVKSVVFAIAIGVIACQRGFAARGGAAEVGAKTTSTVVTCLFGIVLLDAGLTILFQALR